MSRLPLAGDVEAEGAPMILPCPRQKSAARIVRPRRPFAQVDGALLRLGWEAHEGAAQGEDRYAEILFEKLDEGLVAADVPTAWLSAGSERIAGWRYSVCGHEAPLRGPGPEEVSAPAGPFI